VAVLRILLGFLACAISSLSLGMLTVRRLRLDLNRAECVCLGYIIGSAVTSILTLAIALLSLAYASVFIAFSLVGIAVLLWLAPWLRSLKPVHMDSIPRFFRWAFGASWLAYGVIYFRYALAPEMSPDGTAYHLGLVHLWNHAHRMYRLVDMYAALPEGLEMLFLFAFSLGRHSAAALVHFSFLMILPLLMLLYAIRFGISGGAAACAAILVFVTPLVGWDGSVAYNDVALAAVIFASVYLLQMWRTERRTACLAASCLLAGFAFAIKYTGGFVFFLILGAVIWELRLDAFGRKARTLAAGACMMALLPMPYLIRNWIWYRDPVAFFGNSIFPNPVFHASFEREYVDAQKHLNGVNWSELPRELTLGGPKLEQNLGPIYLLAPVALLGFLWPPSRMLVLAAVTAGAAYPGNVSARFLIPALPFLLLAVTFVLSRLPRTAWCLGVLAVFQMVSSLPWVTKYTHNPKIPWPGLNQVFWNAALRVEPEEHYLTRQSDAYVMSRELDRHVPDGETVLAFSGGFLQSYTTRFVMNNSQSGDSQKAMDLLYSNRYFATDASRRFTARFPEVRARELLLLQTATDPTIWSVTEIRLWHGSQRIGPPSAKDLDAAPNPWDIGLAFDGVEASRWRSWESMRPGMHIRARFPSPQWIDRVDVLANDFQWFSNLDIRILTEAGQWVCPVSARWQFDPPVDHRKQAAQTLARQGIHYILISRTAAEEAKFRGDPAAWSLAEVVSTKDATLYRIIESE
jgi:dolichyl-phosphate-mannose-protein mannosyltransferase